MLEVDDEVDLLVDPKDKVVTDAENPLVDEETVLIVDESEVHPKEYRSLALPDACFKAGKDDTLRVVFRESSKKSREL